MTPQGVMDDGVPFAYWTGEFTFAARLRHLVLEP
jgi:hypothetical protein